MCMIHESLLALEVRHFSIYIHVYYLFISIFIILTNVDRLITIYFYVCRWNFKKKKTIETNNQTLNKITQGMEVARALTTVPVKNDDQYIWISMQDTIVFF